MAKIPTVGVWLGGDYRVINTSDYDPDVHSLTEPKETHKTHKPRVKKTDE